LTRLILDSCAAIIVSTFVLAIVSPSQVEAKRNPPGCHNANAAAHNPNCQGGGGTHVTVAPKPPTTDVQTVIVTPGNTQTGQTTGSGAGITTPIVVTAVPPKTFTGNSPYFVPKAPQLVPTPVPQQVPKQIVSAIPPKSVTGYSPNFVPKAPQLVPTPVPQQVPKQNVLAIPPKTFTGNSPYFVPKAPQLVPTPVPQQVPKQIVSAIPPKIPAGSSNIMKKGASIKNRKMSGSKSQVKTILLHQQKGAPITNGKGFIPPKPGHNLVHGYRAFYVDTSGVESVCVLSGLGNRQTSNQTGAMWRSGHTEVLHFRSTSTAHLPSNRAHAGNHCIVSAKKRMLK